MYQKRQLFLWDVQIERKTKICYDKDIADKKGGYSMKKFAALILTGIMTFGCFGTAFAAETKVSVDGVPVVFTDAKPFVDENGRTMVPLRPIANAMGLQVGWIQEQQMAIFGAELPLDFFFDYFDLESAHNITKEELVKVVENVYFTMGEERVVATFDAFYENDKVEADSAEDYMDTVPVVKDGRTYAPARYLAEAFGYDVGWDGATSTVTIVDNR